MAGFETTATEQQKQAVSSRAKTVVVSAGAGSGKTTVLTERIVSRLADKEAPMDIERFLVVTYTNAAAFEMRKKIGDRLLEKVTECYDDEPMRQHLRRQISKLPGAKVQTVHSFCLDLLRRNFSRLGLSAGFTIASDEEKAEMSELAINTVLDAAYTAREPGFSDLCATLCEERGDRKLASAIVSAYNKLRSLPQPEKWLEKQIERTHLSDEQSGALLREEISDICCRRIQSSIFAIEKGRDMLMSEFSGVGSAYAPAHEYCRNMGEAVIAKLRGGEIRAAIELIDSFAPPSATAPRKSPEKAKAIAKDIRDSFKKTISSVREILLLPDGGADCAAAEESLCRLILAYGEALSSEKQRRNRVDFDDLEHFALRLLSNDDGSASETAQEISRYLCELMVDEYQDSNLVQDTIFRLIAPQSGSSFFVGDIKQSIYRFRKADPKIFAARCKDAVNDENSDYIAMDTNFRSRAEVLRTANRMFCALMSEELGDVDYCSPGQSLVPMRQSGGNIPSQLCLIDSSELKDAIAAGGDESASSSEAEAKYVARKIKEMIGHSSVPDGHGGSRPACADDFAILLSSYESKAPTYKAELEKLDIHCYAQSKEDEPWATAPAAVIISLLRLISNRRQDIPLIAVLRSPLFSFSAEELASMRADFPSGDMWDAVAAAASGGNGKAAGFIEQLDFFCDRAKDMSCAGLLQLIYAKTGAYGIFSALPIAQARHDTLDLIYETALRCEGGSFRSCGELVSYIDRITTVPPTSAVSANGVKIMSIHKSKGLEFPFVFVCDLSKRFNLDDCDSDVLIHPQHGIALKYADRRRRLRIETARRRMISDAIYEESLSEELRKLYVAVTRAKEQLFLVISSGRSKIRTKLMHAYNGTYGRPVSDWLSSQNSAAPWILSAFLSGETLPGLTAIIEQGEDFYPGLSEEEADTQALLVQWENSAQAETVTAPQVFDNYETPKNEALFEKYLAMSQMKYPYEHISAIPSKVTPTGIGHAEYVPSGIYSAKRQEGGLNAAQKGTRVHELLARVDLGACLDTDSCRAQAEKYAAPGESVDDNDIAMICGFAKSSWGKRALEAAECIHEYRFGVLFTPKVLGIGDDDSEQILVNGSIDLLLDEGDSMSIVDFKTDSVKPGEEQSAAQVHRYQLEMYARAAREIFGKPVSEMTVFFLKTSCGITL